MSNLSSKINSEKLNEFIGKVVSDWGGAEGALITFIGDRLGLFKAMTGAGELTSEELAHKTGTHPRIIKEWLAGQAAGGYVVYNPDNSTYLLPDEHALALTDENSPAYVIGFYQSLVSLFKDEEKIIQAFKTGKGLGWGDHHHYLFEGTERFFKPNYVANLINSWIPSLENVESNLKKGGAKIADVGCGHGASSILMAKAYPNSKIIGFDSHRPSIEWARRESEKEGLKNVEFEVANSTNYPGDDYDLVTFFDCFHDMGDPTGAAKHVLQTLRKRNGTLMIVEPFANDRLEDNLNPLGRVFYSVSSVVCVPASLNESGPGLGAQAGEQRIKELIKSTGFSNVRKATQTPFNLVFEAKP
ncbi:MAG TPA: class I SAM-dependent methyltransferase [Candidatus Nitrosocosmicus sp.]|nr:class I SAM-dependent methyltransferase [Candidatus Nitrosocosmicus sp.]